MPPNLSYWEKKNFLTDQDLIIVGGGLVGLSTAIQFSSSRPTARVLLVERAPLPLGASTRNAGFACLGSPSELIADVEAVGLENTIDLVRRRAQGIRRLRGLVPDQAMHFEPTGGYEVFTEQQSDLHESCLQHLDLFNTKCRPFLDADIFSVNSQYLAHHKDLFAQTIAAPLEGLIDPAAMIKYMTAKARDQGVDCLHTNVQAVHQNAEGVELETTLGLLTSKHLLIATNGFTQALLPNIEIQPARNVVLVTSPVKHSLRGAFHHQAGYYYFRHIEDRILIGGARHLQLDRESTSEFGIPADLKDHLNSFLQIHVIPNQSFSIEYEWSGIMGFGQNKIPSINRVSPNIMVVAGLGGMGIALGSELGHEASEELAELI